MLNSVGCFLQWPFPLKWIATFDDDTIRISLYLIVHECLPSDLTNQNRENMQRNVSRDASSRGLVAASFQRPPTSPSSIVCSQAHSTRARCSWAIIVLSLRVVAAVLNCTALKIFIFSAKSSKFSIVFTKINRGVIAKMCIFIGSLPAFMDVRHLRVKNGTSRTVV